METCLRGTSLLSVTLLNSNWKCNFLSRVALPDHKCAFRRRRTATLLENKKMNKPAYWCGSPPVCRSHRERKPNPITPRAMTDTAWHVWGLDLALGTHLRIVPKKEKEGLRVGGGATSGFISGHCSAHEQRREVKGENGSCQHELYSCYQG